MTPLLSSSCKTHINHIQAILTGVQRESYVLCGWLSRSCPLQLDLQSHADDRYSLVAVLSTDDAIVVEEEERVLALLGKHVVIQIGNVYFKKQFVLNELINL